MNEKLMAYLYGELSAQERADFEKQIEQNADLQQELKELKSTRSLLRQLEDIQPKSTVVEIKSTPIISMRSIKWMSIAATAALLLLVGKPRLEIGNNGFSLAFGTPPSERMETNTLESVDYAPLIQNAVAQSNQNIYKRLDSIQQQLEVQIEGKEESLLRALEREMNGYQNTQNRNLVRAVSTEYQQNMPRIVSNMQDLQIEQRREIRQMFGTMLSTLWQDVQRQREQDLNAIKAAMIEIRQDKADNVTED